MISLTREIFHFRFGYRIVHKPEHLYTRNKVLYASRIYREILYYNNPRVNKITYNIIEDPTVTKG